MREAPLFSVVIPTYNRVSFIGKALNSVLNQSYRHFEVIVIDDASMDDTQEVVASIIDTKIRFFRKAVNEERAAARNCGVRHAKGQYVTFLDSDDILKIDCLAEANDFLQQHPDATIFHFGYDIVQLDGKIKHRWKPLPNPVNDKLIEGNCLSCIGVFIRREVLIQFPFNEDRDLSASEDYELWMRLAANYPIYTCRKSTACLVDHEARSVFMTDAGKLKKRIERLKYYLTKDPSVQARFGAQFNKINSFLDIYLALHLTMSFHYGEGLRTLFRSLLAFPGIVLSYRFWVVAKKLLLRY